MTSPTNDLKQARIVYKLIRSGRMDGYLDRIIAEIQARRLQLGFEKRAKVELGDIITISDNVRPKLLAGAQCLVIGFEGSKIITRLLQDRSFKWRKETRLTLRPSLIGDIRKTEKLGSVTDFGKLRSV